MKIFRSSKAGLLGIIIALASMIPTVRGEYRSWTPVQGQKYQAQLIWATPTNALLQSGSKKFWVNLAALSDSDKAFIEQETPRVILDWWKNQEVAAQNESDAEKVALDIIQATVDAFRKTPRATSADCVLPNGRRLVVNSLNADSLIIEAKQRCARAVKLKENVETELAKAAAVIEERQKAEAEAQAKIKAEQDKARAEEEARADAKRKVDEEAMAKVKAAEDKVIAEENARRAALAAEESKVLEAKAAEQKARVEAKAAQDKSVREMAIRKMPGKPIGPKVKGLCIGMNIYEAQSVLKEKLVGFDEKVGAVETFDLKAADEGKISGALMAFGMTGDIKESELVVTVGLSILIVAEKQGRVRLIEIGPGLVNKFFKAEEMDASTFVKTFIEAYGIPEMKPSDDLEHWVYTSPDGVKVSISGKKNLRFERAASSEEIKKAFD